MLQRTNISSSFLKYYTGGYEFAFNGKEKDDETYGTGNEYDFDARIYNSRTGRWFSPDKKYQLQPGWSVYKAFLNNPIIYNDPDGRTEYLTIVLKNEQTGKTTTISMVISDKVFSDNQVNMKGDGGHGYYNTKYWYDKQTTIYLTLDKNGNLSSSSDTRLVYEKGPRVETSGPLMSSSLWANTIFKYKTTEWDLPEGEGGVQKGGIYETSEDGGASPTKFKSLSQSTMTDVGDFLTALGAKKSLSIKLNPKIADIAKDAVDLRQKKDEVSGNKPAYFIKRRWGSKVGFSIEETTINDSLKDTQKAKDNGYEVH